MEKLTLINAKQYTNKSGIYHIVIEETNHHYVGSAVNLRKRLNSHRTSLLNKKHRNPKMQNCFNKYGSDRFVFEILEFFSKDVLLNRESYYINKLHPDLNIVLDPVKLNRESEFRHRVSKALKTYYETHQSLSKIKVFKYTLDGNFICEYDSATSAAKDVGGNISAIIAVCNGRAKTHKNFQWRKYKCYQIDSLVKTKPIKEKSIYIPRNRKIVYQYNLDGSFIKEWSHAGEASNTLGIDKRSIGFCADPKRTAYKSAGGYMWSYTKYDRLSKYENHSKDAKNVPIYLLDLVECKEYYFDRIADAARFIKNNNYSFNSKCASLSSGARHCEICIEKYLVRYKNNKYKFNRSNIYININTKEIYKNKNVVPTSTNAIKLIDYARIKFRESEKNHECEWSTLIEDL